MKSFIKSVGSVVGLFVVTVGSALADPCGAPGLPDCVVPEPSSLPLVIVGLVGAVLVGRFFKK